MLTATVWALAVVVAGAQPSVDALRLYLGASGTTCTLHAGSGAPSGSLGAVCDVYARTDSPYTVYQKTGASTWSELYRQGGTDVAVADGGTGVSSWATGDLLYASGATTLAGITDVGAGSLLVSNSGVPGWNASPTVSGTLTAQTSLSTPTLTHSANLTLGPTGDLVLGPAGDDILPDVGYTQNLGALTNKYLTLHAAELWVETLVAQETLATIGGRILTGPTTTLTSDMLSAATSMTVKHNQMSSGDRVFMQAAGKYECIAITSGPSGSGPYTYTVTRGVNSTGADDWYAGDAVFNTGQTGSGFIDQYAINGIWPGSTAGPTVVGNVRTGTNCGDIAPRWAIGNLNGLYGYSSTTYGAAFGDNSAAWVKIDPTNGVRIGHNATSYVTIDPSGNATFAGRLTIGTGRNWLSNTEFRNESSSAFGQSVGSASATSGPQTGISGTRASGAGGGDNRYWIGAFYSGTGSPTWEWLCNNVTYPTGSGGCAFYEFSGGGVPSSSSVKQVLGPSMAAAAGQYFEFSFYSLASSPISSVCARIAFYDSSGASISTVGSNTCATSNPGGGGTLANWVRVWGYGVAPSGATSALPYIQATYDGTDANSAIYLTRMFFGEAGAAQTTPTPWAPGGITTVDGSMLQTDLVITNTIRSSGATDLTTGTGYYLNAGSTPTFRVGNPSGNQVKWDGTDLTIGQDTVTLDNTGIKIAPSTSWETARAYRFDVATGRLGVYGTETGGSTFGRSVGALAEWTGTGNYTNGVNAWLRANHTPGSGGTSYSGWIRVDADSAGADIDMQATNGSIVMNSLIINTDAAIRDISLGYVFLDDEVKITGVSSETTRIVCVKSDGNLGTCSGSVVAGGTCTCS